MFTDYNCEYDTVLGQDFHPLSSGISSVMYTFFNPLLGVIVDALGSGVRGSMPTTKYIASQTHSGNG